eukprot:2847047-Pyramimonas_sp.AAC.1
MTTLTLPSHASLQLDLSDSRVYAAGAVASTARRLVDSLRVGIRAGDGRCRVPTDEVRTGLMP